MQSQTQTPQQPDRLLDRAALASEFGITYHKVTIARLSAEGKFPKPIYLSAKTLRWSAQEVAAWIADRIANRDADSARNAAAAATRFAPKLSSVVAAA